MRIFMIKMSQVKLPVEKVYKLSDNEHVYHGALTQSEKESVKSAAAKLLRMVCPTTFSMF